MKYPQKDINISRDKDDNEYIECAVECNANYIISGDSDLLELKEYNGIKIVTARGYLDIVNLS
ncbi:MAG: putative toxin-antitoxin system toxin component, PIN family [Candidatus Fibromonas sp.]|jgi:predicted nucleic acid-binding protein|nr:putative toxin-antitoxin system toxin component, PIN family [Candidatus Fibromonas sp.]